MKTFKLFDEKVAVGIKKAFSEGEWRDGRETARGNAKEFKNVLQITEKEEKFKQIFDGVKGALSNNLIFSDTVYPRHITNLRAALYRDGGYYDWHVDAAYMKPHRSDVSFTIFLSDPDEYEGGEMEFAETTEIIKHKGALGWIVYYPTGILHRVLPVTKGERFVLVGWVESFVKNNEDREQLSIATAEFNRLITQFEIPEQECYKLRRSLMHIRRILC